MAGSKTRCPKCGTSVVIPVITHTEQETPRAEPTPKPVKRDEPFGKRPDSSTKKYPDRINDNDLPIDRKGTGRPRDKRNGSGRSHAFVKIVVCAIAIPMVLLCCGISTWVIQAKKVGDKAEPNPNQPMPELAKAPEQKKAEPYEFKGDKLGISLEEFKTKYQRVIGSSEYPIITKEDQPWHRIANVVTVQVCYSSIREEEKKHAPTLAGIRSSSHRYMFVDSKLYHIVLVFPHSGFSEVEEAVTRTYGKSNSTTIDNYQNGFGAKFSGSRYNWDNTESTINLVERLESLENSFIEFRHSELYKLVESRKAKIPKPDL